MYDIATEALLSDLYYMNKSAVEVLEAGMEATIKRELPPVDETTPTFRNIHVKNIRCSNARRAMYFNGIPENPIEGIHVEDAKITSKIGVEIKESKNIVLKNIDIIAESGPAVKLENYENVTIENVSGEIVR